MESKQKFEELVQESYLKAKQIILEKAKKLNPFPTMQIGLSRRHTPSTEIDLAEDLPGVLIYDAGQFWTQNYQIILRPEGLYRFSLYQFKETNNGRYTGTVRALPDFNSQSELDAGYITYGRSTLHKIREILESRKQKPRKKK